MNNYEEIKTGLAAALGAKGIKKYLVVCDDGEVTYVINPGLNHVELLGFSEVARIYAENSLLGGIRRYSEQVSNRPAET